MVEKNIVLANIDPRSFYGITNENLTLIQKSFPLVKIAARGSNLIVKGREEDIKKFENVLQQLFKYYNKDNILKPDDIIEIISKGKSSRVGNSSEVILYGSGGKLIRSKTKNQEKFVTLCKKNDLVFATGPAGSGKTYMAIAMAVAALRTKQVKRIILTRPAVEAGEHLGFLPGDLKEKIDPYLQPLYDALLDMIAPRKLAEYLETNIIHIAPLAYMRGRTLSNAFVILDEAQNSTTNQMKMFLTRMGMNAKMVITGDMSQIDLPQKQHSGLVESSSILKDIKGIGHITFDKSDIIRHNLVKEIVNAYESIEKK